MSIIRQQLTNYVMKLSENDYYKAKIPKNVHKHILDFYYDFPIINKEEIINNLGTYVSKDFRANIRQQNIDIYDLLTDVKSLSNNHDKQVYLKDQMWNIEFTTGSTGKPFPIIKSQKTRLIESTYLLKKRKEIFKSANISNGFLFLHPTRKDIRDLDLWRFKERDMEYIVDDWAKSPPKWMFATPYIYYKYAEYMKTRDCHLFKDNRLEFIEYTSQEVSDGRYKLLSDAYNCKIINNYGSREFWNIAYQCSNGNLHINNDYLIVDLADDQGNIITDYNIEGNVIVTHLKNFDMPFFKYYLGDRAKKIKNNCSCGCAGDIIELVQERAIFKLKNTPYFGNKVFRRVMRGLYFHDFFNDIEQIKIIQDGDYHLTVFLKKKKINDEYFEERFLFRTGLIVPQINKFKVDFIYKYPFSNDEYRFKEVIFKSII